MVKNTARVRLQLRKTTLDGMEASAEVAWRYTNVLKRETLYSESYLVFVTSILVVAFVSVGKWNFWEVVRSRSAARPEERTVFVFPWRSPKEGGHNLNSPPPSPNCHLSSVKEKTKQNGAAAADF